MHPSSDTPGSIMEKRSMHMSHAFCPAQSIQVWLDVNMSNMSATFQKKSSQWRHLESERSTLISSRQGEVADKGVKVAHSTPLVSLFHTPHIMTPRTAHTCDSPGGCCLFWRFLGGRGPGQSSSSSAAFAAANAAAASAGSSRPL